MILYLTRYESTDKGTFGMLVADDLLLHTVERPWLNNKPFKSCIPAGKYELHPFTRASGEKVYALENTHKNITIQKEQWSSRYAILIHAGNTVDDVVGCIAPGISRVDHRVMESRKAMKRLINALVEDQFNTLFIEWGDVER